MDQVYHPLQSPIPNTCGIYRILNTTNGKFYIGSAINLNHRRKTHWSCLNKGKHGNPKLQAAWNLHTEKCFVFEVIELVLTPEMLTAREQHYFDILLPFDERGYNLDRIAGSRLGAKHTTETREKIGLASRGNKHSLGKPSPKRGTKMSDEAHAKMSIAAKNRPSNRLGTTTSPEARANISKAQREKRLTPEHKAKISKSLQGNTRTLGYHPTPEARAKMSQSQTGRTHTQETKEKMRLAQLGKERSPEYRANISAAKKGRKSNPDFHTSQMKTLIAIDPDGNEYTVTGITRFCREHNLLRSNLMQVAQGKYSQHRGWKARLPEGD